MMSTTNEINARGAQLKATRVRRGQWLGLKFTPRDRERQPLDLTGAVAHARIALDSDTEVTVIPARIEDGSIYVDLEPEVTSALGPVSELGVSLEISSGRPIPLVYGLLRVEGVL